MIDVILKKATWFYEKSARTGRNANSSAIKRSDDF